MQKLILIISLTLSFSTFAWEGILDCSNFEERLIIKVEKDSSETTAYSNYDLLVPKAKASIAAHINGEQYKYTNNVFVIDEGQGNFKIEAFAILGNTLEKVASIYFEHEGSYVSGFFKKPVFRTYRNGDVELENFLQFGSFDELACILK